MFAAVPLLQAGQNLDEFRLALPQHAVQMQLSIGAQEVLRDMLDTQPDCLEINARLPVAGGVKHGQRPEHANGKRTMRAQ